MDEDGICIRNIVWILGADDCRIIGDENIKAIAPAPLFNGPEGGFSFHDSQRIPDVQAVLRDSRSSIIITNAKDISQVPTGKVLVLVDRPRNAYVRVVHHLLKQTRSAGSIHSSAVIDSGAKLHDSAIIGPGCVIGKCVIGENSSIEANTIISSGARIGRNVRIKSGVVIGNDGFSFERDDNGGLMKFPHSGGIVIEDDVEIGSNTVIDRGTFGDTFIGKGTKIDNLCHIAHNVRIGKDCLIIAHSVISGSDRIGDRVWISPGVLIMDGISVGNDAFVGIGAVVIRDVTAEEKVFGNPARPMLKK